MTFTSSISGVEYIERTGAELDILQTDPLSGAYVYYLSEADQGNILKTSPKIKQYEYSIASQSLDREFTEFLDVPETIESPINLSPSVIRRPNWVPPTSTVATGFFEPQGDNNKFEIQSTFAPIQGATSYQYRYSYILNRLNNAPFFQTNDTTFTFDFNYDIGNLTNDVYVQVRTVYENGIYRILSPWSEVTTIQLHSQDITNITNVGIFDIRRERLDNAGRNKQESRYRVNASVPPAVTGIDLEYEKTRYKDGTDSGTSFIQAPINSIRFPGGGGSYKKDEMEPDGATRLRFRLRPHYGANIGSWSDYYEYIVDVNQDQSLKRKGDNVRIIEFNDPYNPTQGYTSKTVNN